MRGGALALLERYQDALASFDQAIELDPDNYQAWDSRGNALSSMGCNQMAIEAHRKSISINKQFPPPYESLARLYYIQGQYNLAITLLKDALSKKLRGSPDLWNDLGFIYLTKDKLTEAKVSFNRSLQTEAHQFHPTFNLGLVYIRRKKVKLAKQLIERSLLLCEADTPQRKLYIALCKIALGEKYEGLQSIKEILSTMKDSQVKNALHCGVLESAQILARSNHFSGMDEVVEAFQQALDI